MAERYGKGSGEIANGHERQGARTSGVALSKSVAVRDGAVAHAINIDTYPKSLMQGSLWPRLLRTATRGPGGSFSKAAVPVTTITAPSTVYCFPVIAPSSPAVHIQ
jgi:hypothetical protein